MNFKPNPFLYTFSVLFYLLFTVSYCFAQEGSKNSLYQTWIKFNKNQQEATGYLYEVKTNSLEIVSKIDQPTGDLGMNEIQSIQYQDISQLKIRKKGAIGKGAWIGALSGLAAGVIVGLLLYDPDDWWSPSKLELIAGTCVFSVPTFTGIGMAIGSKKHKIPIQANPQYFRDNKLLLEEYVLSE